MTKESWFENIAGGVLNELKPRASWAKVGSKASLSKMQMETMMRMEVL